MKAKLTAGASIELLTRDEVRAELARDRRRRAEHEARNRAIVRTVENMVVLDAAGAGTIDLGTPNPGRSWDVRRVSACYQDPAAALAAGIAAIMRGNDPLSPYGFVERLPNGTQLPASDTFSAQQLTLQQDEHLYIRVSGGAAGSAVFGSAQVADSPRGVIFELDDDDASNNGALSSVR
jgi:hypothetical protein